MTVEKKKRIVPSNLLLLIPFQVTILDAKKSMNIGIFLRHFKR